MANLERRTRKSDGVMSVSVRWKDGGTRAGVWQTENFAAGASAQNETRAAAFKLDVEAAGHRWPEGWVRGEGYVVPEEKPAVTTMADAAAAYFAHGWKVRVPRNKVSAAELDKRERVWENHLVGTFGPLGVPEVTRDDVEDWITVQIEEVPAKDGTPGAAAKSVRNRHWLLSTIIKHAVVELRLRPDNPCYGSDLPVSADARQVRFFQHGEWALMRGHLAPDVLLMVDVALTTGIRWGELSALRCRHVSFPTPEDGDDGCRAVVHIEQAWKDRSKKDKAPIRADLGENRSWKLGPPKNKTERYVVLTGVTAQALKDEVAGLTPEQFLFRTRYGNPWRYPDFYTDRWKPAREAAVAKGLTKHATPHMLRHTCVVWSLADGVDIYRISHMIGHADITTTHRVYGGMLNLKDPAMAQAMAKGMLTVRQALVPAATAEEIAARPVRTRRRRAA